MNGDPFELALALLKYGFKVPEIYGTITAENFVYMKQLALLSPETRVFSNMEPTMIYYDPAQSGGLSWTDVEPGRTAVWIRRGEKAV